MNLYEKIMALYPDLQPQDFFNIIHLQDNSDGNGSFIAKWEHPTLAKPTAEQLA
jgi:hypothetical protein